MSKLLRILVAGWLAALLAGCAASKPEDTHLKVALLPILDVIPVFVAQQNGYFAEQGIQVDQVPVKSAQERDVLMQTGQIDGQLNDLVSTALFDKDSIKIKIVYTARRAFPEAPMLRILAGPKTSIKSVSDLKGVPIGISQNSVIEYLTVRLLEAEGLKADDIKVQEVTAIPVRFEQLMNGNIPAATLPDPLAQGAIAEGARLVVDDSKHTSLSQSVLSFSVASLQSKPNTIKKFLVAWEKAVAEVNAHPEKYQDLLVQQGRVPKSIENSYKMPPFPLQSIPSQAEMSDVVQWLRAKGAVSRDIPYADMVDPAYLPR